LKEKLKNFYRPIYKYILLRQNNEFRIDHERKVTEIAHTENTAPSSDYHWAWQLVGIEKETKKSRKVRKMTIKSELEFLFPVKMATWATKPKMLTSTHSYNSTNHLRPRYKPQIYTHQVGLRVLYLLCKQKQTKTNHLQSLVQNQTRSPAITKNVQLCILECAQHVHQHLHAHME
jgi:hypothetical protein